MAVAREECAVNQRGRTIIVLAMMLAACRGPKDTVVDPAKAYGVSPVGALACELLQASRCAYAIRDTENFDTSDPAYAACATSALERHALVGIATRADRPERKINAVLVELLQDKLIVAYRGTLPPGGDSPQPTVIADWLQDFDADPVSMPGIPGAKVHDGFHKAFLDTSTGLHAQLAAWRDAGSLKGRPIYLTGHSKGGPVALIAAAVLSGEGFTPTAVYTYAGARAGDGAFAADYASRRITTWRYENRFDAVPHLPPDDTEIDLIKLLARGDPRMRQREYRSIGNLLFINWAGHITADYPQLARNRREAVLEQVGNLSFLKTVVDAHALDGQYQQAVCAGAQAPSAAH
jgi:hypothetical protein